MPTPLGEFLALDLFDILAASDSARWVDEQTLEGVLCDHLVFRNAERGLQVWVPRRRGAAGARIRRELRRREARARRRHSR